MGRMKGKDTRRKACKGNIRPNHKGETHDGRPTREAHNNMRKKRMKAGRILFAWRQQGGDLHQRAGSKKKEKIHTWIPKCLETLSEDMAQRTGIQRSIIAFGFISEKVQRDTLNW